MGLRSTEIRHETHPVLWCVTKILAAEYAQMYTKIFTWTQHNILKQAHLLTFTFLSVLILGTIRPVRRSFYDPASAPGQGWQWEWENDAGSWTPYDIEVAIAIGNAHSRQQPCLDLTTLGFCYLIDFQNMTQV